MIQSFLNWLLLVVGISSGRVWQSLPGYRVATTPAITVAVTKSAPMVRIVAVVRCAPGIGVPIRIIVVVVIQHILPFFPQNQVTDFQQRIAIGELIDFVFF